MTCCLLLRQRSFVRMQLSWRASYAKLQMRLIGRAFERANRPRLIGCRYDSGAPDLKEFRAMAGHLIVVGYCGTEEPTRATAAERPQLYKSLSGRKRAGCGFRERCATRKLPLRKRGCRRLPPKKLAFSLLSRATRLWRGRGR